MSRNYFSKFRPMRRKRVRRAPSVPEYFDPRGLRKPSLDLYENNNFQPVVEYEQDGGVTDDLKGAEDYDVRQIYNSPRKFNTYPYYNFYADQYVVPSFKKYFEANPEEYLYYTNEIGPYESNITSSNITSSNKTSDVVDKRMLPTYEVSAEAPYDEDDMLNDYYYYVNGHNFHPHYENGRYYYAIGKSVYKRGGRFRKGGKFWSKEF